MTKSGVTESANNPIVQDSMAAAVRPARRSRRVHGPSGDSWIVLGIQIFLVLVIAIVWEMLSRSGTIDPFLFSRPTAILDYFWNAVFVERTALAELGWTMLATVLAFASGSAAAILTGLWFTTFPRAERVLQPAMTGLNALPRIALAPLFLIWFGLGISSKVALGFSLTYFIVLSSTVAAIRGVDSDLMILARTLGATPSQAFRKITLPHAVPVIFAGLRLGLIYALLGVIASELTASENGLGQTLKELANTFQTDGVFAILLLLGLVGSALSAVMYAIEARLMRWR